MTERDDFVPDGPTNTRSTGMILLMGGVDGPETVSLLRSERTRLPDLLMLGGFEAHLNSFDVFHNALPDADKNYLQLFKPTQYFRERRGHWCCRYFICGRSVLWQRIPADLIVQRPSALIRLYSQIFTQEDSATLILAQRPRAIARHVKQAHELPVCTLARAVVTKNQSAIPLTILILLM